MAISSWLAILPCLASPFMGTEAFGNKPVPKQDGWAEGVHAVANDTHRVYTRWVNGNEDFVYRGDIAAINAALVLFAAIGDDQKEVVLRADPGETRTFERKLVKYDWRMHVPSGIYLHMAKLEKGTQVMARHPSLTIHVHAKLPVEKLSIPDGLKLVGYEDLVARYAAGVKSESPSIRYQSLARLSAFPHADSALDLVVEALNDDDGTVRIVGARALESSFDSRAQTALERLKQLRDDPDEKWCEEYAEIVSAVSKAKAKPKSPIRAGQIARIRAVIDACQQGAEKKTTDHGKREPEKD